MGGFYGMGFDLEVKTGYLREAGQDNEPLYIHGLSGTRIWCRALELAPPGLDGNHIALLFKTVTMDCFYYIADAVIDSPLQLFDELSDGPVRRNEASFWTTSLEPEQVPHEGEVKDGPPSFCIPILVPWRWCRPASSPSGRGVDRRGHCLDVRENNHTWSVQVPDVAAAARTVVVHLGRRLEGELKARRAQLCRRV